MHFGLQECIQVSFLLNNSPAVGFAASTVQPVSPRSKDLCRADPDGHAAAKTDRKSPHGANFPPED